MTTQQLRAMIQTTPFRPFRIHLADGRNLRVNHPDYIMRSPSGRSAILCRPDDTFEVIDLLLVTTLEVVNGARGNGRKRNGKRG